MQAPRYTRRIYPSRELKHTGSFILMRRQSTKRKFRARTKIRGPSTAYLAREIEKIKRGEQLEWKFHDVSQSSTVITSTGTFFKLSEIAQGNTSQTREGLKIRLHSIDLRYRIALNESNLNGNIMRMILFYDTENSGSYPTASELLESETITSHKEMHENRGRFKILFDKVYCLNESVADTGKSIYKKYYKKFKKFAPNIEYVGSNADESHNGKNALFLYCLGEEVTNGPAIVFDSRIRFTG